MSAECNCCGHDLCMNEDGSFVCVVCEKSKEIASLCEQNKILMDALEIYADKNSWIESINAEGNLTGDFDLLNISKHGYEPAAEAIKKVKGEAK